MEIKIKISAQDIQMINLHNALLYNYQGGTLIVLKQKIFFNEIQLISYKRY